MDDIVERLRAEAKELDHVRGDLLDEAATEIRRLRSAAPSDRDVGEVTPEQIKHMVDRFLGWKLPEDFRPDAGISFNPHFNVEYNAQCGLPPQRHEPSGTNLFDATQAEEMVRYILEGIAPKVAP